MKRINLAILTMSISLILTGCKDIQIFETQTDPNVQVEVNDNELLPDTYYVKNGTKFVSVYKPNGNSKEQANVVKKSRVFWMIDTVGDENLIPSHYQGELIAYASERANISEVSLERYKDLGNSIGVYGGTIENDGYYHIKIDDKQVPESSMRKIFDETPSDEIRIQSINGEKVSYDIVDKDSGVFLGLEAGKTYKIAFFSGTYYYEADVVADTHFLQAYELYTYGLEQIYDTKNGYMCFETPADLKSGWYNINGSGLFKYYNFKKGEQDIINVSMNESYYATQDDMIAACSAEYSFLLTDTTANLTVEVPILNYGSEEFVIYAYSPSGTMYTMEASEKDKLARLTVSEAMAGKWKINVLPKNLKIDDINVYAEKETAEMTLKEDIITFVEEDQNIIICVDYTGEGDVNGMIIGPSGETYVMEELGKIREEFGIKTYKIGYAIPYVQPGNYTVKIYHHPIETTIGEPYTEETGNSSSDIITITE